MPVVNLQRICLGGRGQSSHTVIIFDDMQYFFQGFLLNLKRRLSCTVSVIQRSFDTLYQSISHSLLARTLIYNYRQKQLRHSPKKACFVKCVSFFNLQFSHFDPLSPFQCYNHVTVSTRCISTLKTLRGVLSYRQKGCYLKLRKDADRKCLLCSDVSTLLSLIVDYPICHGLQHSQFNFCSPVATVEILLAGFVKFCVSFC